MEVIENAGNGLWYSKNEGKVQAAWVYQLCQSAGVNPFDLPRNVWLKFEYDNTTKKYKYLGQE